MFRKQGQKAYEYPNKPFDFNKSKELTEDEVIRRDGGRKLGKWVILKEYSTKDSE